VVIGSCALLATTTITAVGQQGPHHHTAPLEPVPQPLPPNYILGTQEIYGRERP
jgi:hypothetical protein